MRNGTVRIEDTVATESSKFTAAERVMLAVGALVMTAWITTLAWVGFKLVGCVI